MTSHWIFSDGKLIGRIHYAVCGQMIPVEAHSETPTCLACERLKAEHDRELEQLAAEEGIRFIDDDPRRV